MSVKTFHPTPTFLSAKKLAKEIGLTSQDKKVVSEVRRKHKPNAAFMRPLTPSATLAVFVGKKAIPRTVVTKKIWAYVKKNGLQDSKNIRIINADDKLKRVFGGKQQVSMFEMTRLVNKHLK